MPDQPSTSENIPAPRKIPHIPGGVGNPTDVGTKYPITPPIVVPPGRSGGVIGIDGEEVFESPLAETNVTGNSPAATQKIAQAITSAAISVSAVGARMTTYRVPPFWHILRNR